MIELINFWKGDLQKFKSSFQTIISQDIYLFSIFGDINNIYKFNNKKKILIIGENIDRDKYKKYNDKHILEQFNLVLGFKYLDHENYIRYPNWLYHNSYFIDDQEKYISFIVNHQYQTNYDISDKKPICLISRSDIDGLRNKLLKIVKLKIDCPSKVGKNCPSIENQNLTKIDFMKRYIFNICPENSLSEGYTTEKLFECVFANCIPIYYGTLGKEEMEIFNLDRIIFIDVNNLDAINDVIMSNKIYDFYNKPIFNPKSENIVIDLINKLKLKLNNL